MDGSSLATVESTALTQGVAFLYAQAGELLRRRREARNQAGAAPGHRTAEEETRATTPADTAPGLYESLPTLQLPEGVFDDAGKALQTAAPETLDQLAGSLLQARREVDDYVVGMATLGGDSQAGLQAADRLRCLLEEVYGAALTFRGEKRTAGRDTGYVHAQDVGVAASKIKAKYIAGHDINIERE
jgi:hypothetical protein